MNKSYDIPKSNYNSSKNNNSSNILLQSNLNPGQNLYLKSLKKKQEIKNKIHEIKTERKKEEDRELTFKPYVSSASHNMVVLIRHILNCFHKNLLE